MLQPSRSSEPDAPLPPDHICFGCDGRAGRLCGAFDAYELARFRALGRTLRLGAGDLLVHEGERVTRVLILVEGAMKAYRLLPDGRRQITGFLFPGDLIGSAPAGIHGECVEAIEASSLCWLPSSRFDALLGSHEAMALRLFRIVAAERESARSQLLRLGRMTAMERLASFLVDLLDRGGAAAGNLVALPMSRADIADHLGLTQETVSRVIATLRRRRILRLAASGKIEILEPQAVRAIAAGSGP